MATPRLIDATLVLNFATTDDNFMKLHVSTGLNIDNVK